MEFPGLATFVQAAPVIDPVGGVGVLLDLEDQEPLANGVDASAGDEDRVACGDRDGLQG